MIDYVEGILTVIEPEFAVVHVGGWGIKLFISLNTYEELKNMTEGDIRLYAHMVIKDDIIELIGFQEAIERQAFIMLNKVSGIGTKVGLAILSYFTVPKLKACIFNEDVDSLIKVPGIGKKTAQRMIIELKDRFKELSVESQDYTKSRDIFEAEEVLISLGFSINEVQKVLRILSEHQKPGKVEDIIKNALKQLSR